MERYQTLDQYYKSRFGGKVYKLALDAGFTCPNRDSTLDTRGCIFCSAGGSGDFAEASCGSVAEQVEAAKLRVSKKAKNAVGYIAYLQSYTNTYAPVARLRELYFSVESCKDIVGISIATRPDCLGEDVLELLSELNQKIPVFVELGLQTIWEETASLIRRGYTLEVFDKALENLKKIGVNVIVHVILGLPGETHEMMLETVKYVGKSGADGIKIQLLHILKETDLYEMYRNGLCDAMEENEYLTLVCEALEWLPSNMVIHRLTGDGPKSTLVAPLWSANKREVLNRLRKMLEERDVHQGARLVE